MKKSWKKLLCSLMLAPCMFVATACGDDPEDPSNLTTDLTIEQQQEAYTTLRTVAAAALNNDGSKDQNYVLENTTKFHRVYDLSHTGLTGALMQEAVALTTGIDERIDSKTSYVGYKSNNTGYSLVKSEVKTSSDLEPVKTSTSSITKYNGQRYVNYLNDGTNKTISYVANDYSKNQYVADLNKMGEGSSNYIIGEMLDIVDNDQTFDQFKPLIGKWAATHILMSCHSGEYDYIYNEYLDTIEDLNYTYKLSMVEGNYVLTVDVAATIEDVVTWPLDHVGDMYANGGLDIVFTDKGIISLNMDYETGVTTQFTCESFFNGGNLAEQVYTDDNYIISTGVSNGKVAINFDSNFDNNFFNQNTSDYRGTGDNGAIENELFTLTIHTEIDDWGVITVNVPSGSSIKESVENGLESYLNGTEYYIHSIYHVEGYENEIGDNEKLPSCDKDVYVRLANVNQIVTEITLNVTLVGHYAEETVIALSNYPVYLLVQSLYGLQESDIIGVYTDEGLTQILDSNATTVDGMTLYVKVTNTWQPSVDGE